MSLLISLSVLMDWLTLDWLSMVKFPGMLYVHESQGHTLEVSLLKLTVDFKFSWETSIFFNPKKAVFNYFFIIRLFWLELSCSCSIPKAICYFTLSFLNSLDFLIYWKRSCLTMWGWVVRCQKSSIWNYYRILNGGIIE